MSTTTAAATGGASGTAKVKTKSITLKNKLAPGFVILASLIFIIVMGALIFSGGSSKKHNSENSTGSSEYYWKDTVVFVKDSTVFLKKGEIVHLPIAINEICYCSGGGKQYYHQGQNQQKVLIGGGLLCPKTDGVAYIDLSPNDEEISVVCTFMKKIKVKIQNKNATVSTERFFIPI